MPAVSVIASTPSLAPSVTAKLRSRGFDVVAVDWSETGVPELKRALAGAVAVVNLVADADGTREALEATGSVGATTYVQLSTAAVYGAWPDNPVPLTEREPLRPNPGVTAAASAAESERLVAEWRDDHPACRVVVLRPAITLAAGHPSFPPGLAGIDGVRTTDPDRRVQFVHADDVAEAVALAVTGDASGTFNVAPDGWITEEAARAIAGTPTRLAWPSFLLRLRRRKPSDPYRQLSWVVANDRLKAAGWQPSTTNEEALVLTRRPTVWQRIPASRKQEITLGVSGAAIAGLAATVVAIVRRRSRSH